MFVLPVLMVLVKWFKDRKTRAGDGSRDDYPADR
jgi:hypothetical protein